MALTVLFRFFYRVTAGDEQSNDRKEWENAKKEGNSRDEKKERHLQSDNEQINNSNENRNGIDTEQKGRAFGSCKMDSRSQLEVGIKGK